MTVIGAMPLARSVLVPGALLALSDAFPAHRISILDGPYESMLAALLDGRADLLVGALREAPSSQVFQTALFEDPLIVVGRSGHPLQGRSTTAAQLRDAAWIAPRESSPLRRQFDHLIGHNGYRAPIECNSLVAARELLMASDRLMLISRHQVRREIEAGILVAVPHPFGAISRLIGLTRRRDWVPTTAQAFLMETLFTEAAKVGCLL
jgi:DNA-binding transcriptional LysR family regulator